MAVGYNLDNFLSTRTFSFRNDEEEVLAVVDVHFFSVLVLLALGALGFASDARFISFLFSIIHIPRSE
jgi:hypothetical protein